MTPTTPTHISRPQTLAIRLGGSTLYRQNTGTTLAQAIARATVAHAAHSATRGQR